MRTMMNPQMLQGIVQMQQAMAGMQGAGAGTPALGAPPAATPTPGATPGAPGAPAPGAPGAGFDPMAMQAAMQAIMGGAGGGAAGGAAGGLPGLAAANDGRPAEERFATQLEQLAGMGFGDRPSNIQALQMANGDVNQAINFLLGGEA
ncbi:Ubiquilin-4 [Symbiodinium microadriaticum]|uniref:Ubiquilin-4 n=1 Tax=Symbiodinium microadriaticum TaxID=2951 RepID=A0A1Q9BWA5_SYMMI|nr:Ubiquilin-4 [Symbiodinium microadriaticum]